jgi:hypothetical protein
MIINVKPENAFGILTTKKLPILANDGNRDRDTLNLLRKALGIKQIESAALIPVIAFGKQQVE